jgi:hypothetical protein
MAVFNNCGDVNDWVSKLLSNRGGIVSLIFMIIIYVI